MTAAGAISGTPTGEGLSTFGATVQDSIGATALQGLAIEVDSNPAISGTSTVTTAYTYDWMGHVISRVGGVVGAGVFDRKSPS
jgi:hypothetical protein